MSAPKVTAKQEGGDDGYCYVVRVDGVAFIRGITRSEVPYYKKQALKAWEEKHGSVTKKCGCREPRHHAGCQYCGCYWAGEVVCGVCHEAGIDGRVIRGTERRVCAAHKNK